MHIVKIHKTIIRLPDKLESMTTEQAKKYLLCKFSDIAEDNRQKEFLWALLDNKQRKWFLACNVVQQIQILALLDWFSESLPNYPLLSSFVFKGKKYHAPQENMQSSVLAEFILCDTILMSYQKDKNYLEKLTAILYREAEPKKIGDIRQKLDTDKTDIAAKAFEKIDAPYKLSALAFFLAVKEHISNAYQEAFEDDEDSEDLGGGWGFTLYSIAESHTFGVYEDVKFCNLYEILNYLVKKKREYKAQKRNQEKANKR